jgi:hypothetical protein
MKKRTDGVAVPLRRIRAGIYETPDGEHRIMRTDGWEGPKGGRLFLWEHAQRDATGDTWTLDNQFFATTKREAQAELTALLIESVAKTKEGH